MNNSTLQIKQSFQHGTSTCLDLYASHQVLRRVKCVKWIRKYVEHLHVDRPLYTDHNAMKKLVQSGEILEEVEKVVGNLG